MHSEERAISLSLKVLPYQPRPARNPFQVRNSVRPMHLFGHTFDHDYYFELPREGERDTHSIARCFTSHHRDFRAFPRTNRTFSTARNPIPSVASSTNEPPACAPWPPWRFSVLAASSGGHIYSAQDRLRIMAICLLFAYPLRTDLGGVPDPQLKLQFCE